MAPKLHIRRVDPQSPAAAAEAIAREIGAAAPHGRDVCVVAVQRGDAPGMAVAPWTLAGVKRAHHGASVHVDTLKGSVRAHGDALHLQWPGVARALRVPRAWLGRRLVLLTPCVVATSERRVHFGHGPVAAAFEALAIAAGAPATGDPSGLGARIAAHVFAHVAVIIDASWSSLVGGESSVARFATARCVGLQAPCPTADGQAVRVQEIDAWLVRRLGLFAPGGGSALTLHGDADDPRWISAHAPADALADREVAALLRGPSRPGSARSAGRPRQPDALDRAWAAWTERPA